MGCLNITVEIVSTAPLDISLETNTHSIECDIKSICSVTPTVSISVNKDTFDSLSYWAFLVEVQVTSETEWEYSIIPSDISWLTISRRSSCLEIQGSDNEGLVRQAVVRVQSVEQPVWKDIHITQSGQRVKFSACDVDYLLQDGAAYAVLRQASSNIN